MNFLSFGFLVLCSCWLFFFLISMWFDKMNSYSVIMSVLNSFSTDHNSSGKSTVSEGVFWLTDITRACFEMCEMFQSKNKLRAL